MAALHVFPPESRTADGNAFVCLRMYFRVVTNPFLWVQMKYLGPSLVKRFLRGRSPGPNDGISRNAVSFHDTKMAAEPTLLEGWTNFYVIVGSSAGALIGLQFVVIALLANRPRVSGEGQAGSAFATPNIVHFSTVLLLSAALSAPWSTISSAAVLWGIVGVVGTVYQLMIARRMRAQRVYRPVLEDWMFHAVFPLAAYSLLAVSACAAPLHPGGALVGVAVAALVLMFTAIHNAWDAASYHIFSGSAREQDSKLTDPKMGS